MSQYNCQSEIPRIDGLEDNTLTVGRHVLLNCKSESAEANSVLAFDKAEFKLDEAAKYSIKLFKTTVISPSEFNLDLTFYTAGEQQLRQLILTDGTNEINLNGTSVKVESVLKPSADGKPPQPFGSVFPLSISIPALYILFLAGILLLFLVYTVFKAKRLAYYKRLKAKLDQYNSPIEPDTQFYKSIRSAEKLNYPLEQIEKTFRLYNLRAYRLPMFDLINERIYRYFKRNYPQHKTTRLGLQKILGEFEELAKKSNELSLEEKNEFVKKLYRYVDKNPGLNS